MTQQEMITWLHDMAEGPMAHNPEHADTCNTLTAIRVELERLQADLDALKTTLAGVKSMHADSLERCERLQAIVNKQAELSRLTGDRNFPLAAAMLCQQAADSTRPR